MSLTERQNIIDVVIPTHYKDLSVLNHCIRGIRANVANVRRIIVVSKIPYSNEAEWFDESNFPFSIEEVASYVGPASAGWYFQQLLKLYAPIAIPDISSNVLVVDSDTVFMRKVTMLCPVSNLPLYNLSKDQDVLSNPFYQKVIGHIGKLLPELTLDNIPPDYRQISGISHHMLFQKNVIEDLFGKVEAGDSNGEPFYKIFLKHSDSFHSASEYNLYYWFILYYYFNQVKFRSLKYKNTADFNVLKYRLRRKYHYCSFHSYMRNGEGEKGKIKEKLKVIFNKLFFCEAWNIGIADFPIADFLSKKAPNIKWFKEAGRLLGCSFIVDPFGFEWEGKRYIAYEKFSYYDKIGKIAVSELDSNLELKDEKIILHDLTHSSYPYVFKYQEQLYLIVERNKAKVLELYKLLPPYELVKVNTLLTDLRVVDPSIINYNNSWWLFFTVFDQGDDKLHIAYSDSLLGEWHLHPANPVKISYKSSRSAGTPFLYQGELYRPAQNCEGSYGASVVINKITKLSFSEFLEEEVKELMPNQASVYSKGLHTISEFGNITLIDGKRNKFVPFKFLLSITRNLRKKFTPLIQPNN